MLNDYFMSKTSLQSTPHFDVTEGDVDAMSATIEVVDMHVNALEKMEDSLVYIEKYVQDSSSGGKVTPHTVDVASHMYRITGLTSIDPENIFPSLEGLESEDVSIAYSLESIGEKIQTVIRAVIKAITAATEAVGKFIKGFITLKGRTLKSAISFSEKLKTLDKNINPLPRKRQIQAPSPLLFIDDKPAPLSSLDPAFVKNIVSGSTDISKAIKKFADGIKGVSEDNPMNLESLITEYTVSVRKTFSMKTGVLHVAHNANTFDLSGTVYVSTPLPGNMVFASATPETATRGNVNAMYAANLVHDRSEPPRMVIAPLSNLVAIDGLVSSVIALLHTTDSLEKELENINIRVKELLKAIKMFAKGKGGNQNLDADRTSIRTARLMANGATKGHVSLCSYLIKLALANLSYAEASYRNLGLE